MGRRRGPMGCGSRRWTVITGVAVLRVGRQHGPGHHRQQADRQLYDSHSWTSVTHTRKADALRMTAPRARFNWGAWVYGRSVGRFGWVDARTFQNRRLD